MNLNTFSAGMALLLMAVVVIQGVQLHNTKAQVDSLSTSLQILQQVQKADIALTRDENATDVLQNHAQDDSRQANVQALESRVATLERHLREQESQRPDMQQEQLRNQAQQLADNLINAGYVDDQQWQTVASEVESMDKESNRAFWERTFAAIESGTLAVYGSAAQ